MHAVSTNGITDILHINYKLEKDISFDSLNNYGAIDVKIYVSVLDEKTSFKMVVLSFSSKLDWSSYILSVANTSSKKIDLSYEVSFLSTCSFSQ